ncbi:UNVERIFIED_CONTAM: Transposon Ty3-G Gag-Pol polyprotein [Sesamum radiatum]|uniref:Transposon Ty3-G Gag-Pol polyprotein n=1 Tax=Sesamum radiatum TaxID=300843 RepID=A0AAW2RE29_SESRA
MAALSSWPKIPHFYRPEEPSFLLTQTVQTPAQHKWLSKLLGFDYEIIYTPGKDNVVADALSRHSHAYFAVLLAVSFVTSSVLTDLRKFYSSTPEGQSLVRTVGNSSSSKLVFSDTHDVILLNDRLFVPDASVLRFLLLSEFHSSPIGGHSSVRATLGRLAFSFYWPKMRYDVQQFVKACSVCQHHKYSTDQPIGLLQPLPIPNQVWEDLSMDFITHLPPSGGRTVIWVVVDRLSKYAHFVGLLSKFTIATLAASFTVEIYRLHGMPKSIVNDRDPLFLSKFWRELFRLSGTKLAYSSAYHPQSNGQTEALYGRTPPTISSYISRSSPIAALDDVLCRRQSVLSMARYHLARAHLRMKQQTDRHRRDLSFAVRDWVLLRLQPYRQLSVRRRGPQKLSPRFFGPFRIILRLGPVVYELAFPPESPVHPVFHASFLKPFHGDPDSASIIAPPETADPLLDFTSSRIVESDASWVSVDEFLSSFPDFDLEDKVVFGGPGTDTTQIHIGPLNTEGELLLEGPTTSGLTSGSMNEGPIRKRSNRVTSKPAKYKDYYMQN